jgi:methionyl-tRNA formyltransferase
MKISVFLNADLESNIALNCLLPMLSNHEFKIYLSEKVGGNSTPILALAQLGVLEKGFVFQRLFPLIETTSHGGFLSFLQIKEKFQVPLEVIQEVTTPETVAKIAAFQPDLFLSIRFGKIFKGAILQVPKNGIINLHSAILPDYKGVLGTLRAFQHQEKEIGCTLHYISDNTIDTGNILHIERLPVSPGKSVLWHIIQLYLPGTKALSNIVEKIAAEIPITTTPQTEGGMYFTFPTVDEFDKIMNLGFDLFQVEEYGELLHHFYGVDQTWVSQQIADLLAHS